MSTAATCSRVDLSSTDNRALPKAALLRADGSESLSWPAWWPDGSAFVFQREDQAAPAVNSPDGFARPPARIELANADGSSRRVLDPVAWQPSPAPDGSAIALRALLRPRLELARHVTADGSERVLVDAGRFPEIFSPRYSPDGTTIAFGARSYDDLTMPGWPVCDRQIEPEPRTPMARWPTSGWSIRMARTCARCRRCACTIRRWRGRPNGSQIFGYGSWGGVLIDLPSGENTLMTYLTGTTAVAWLP